MPTELAASDSRPSASDEHTGRCTLRKAGPTALAGARLVVACVTYGQHFVVI